LPEWDIFRWASKTVRSRSEVDARIDRVDRFDLEARRVFVHFERAHLWEAIEGTLAARAGFLFRRFSIPALDAKSLFETAGTRSVRRADAIETPFEPGTLEGEAPEIVVLGFGPLGEAVVLEGLLREHHADRPGPRIRVLHPDGPRLQRDFESSHPAASKVGEVVFDGVDPSTPAGLERLVTVLQGTRSLPMIVWVAPDPGGLALATILRFLEQAEVDVPPIHVHATRTDDAGALARHVDQGVVRRFGGQPVPPILDRSRTSAIERMAYEVHRQYLVSALTRGPDIDWRPSMQVWSRLPERLREDNRRQVEHNFTKLDDVDWCALPPSQAPRSSVRAGSPFAEAHVLWSVARAEKRRWNASRQLDGWRLGPRDDTKKLHPLLVSFDELPAEEQLKDVDAVRALPTVMAAHGYAVVPNLRRWLRLPAWPEPDRETVRAFLEREIDEQASEARMVFIVILSPGDVRALEVVRTLVAFRDSGSLRLDVEVVVRGRLFEHRGFGGVRLGRLWLLSSAAEARDPELGSTERVVDYPGANGS